MIKYLSEMCFQRLLSLGGKCLGHIILAPISSHKEKNNKKKTYIATVLIIEKTYIATVLIIMRFIICYIKKINIVLN